MVLHIGSVSVIFPERLALCDQLVFMDSCLTYLIYLEMFIVINDVKPNYPHFRQTHTLVYSFSLPPSFTYPKKCVL